VNTSPSRRTEQVEPKVQPGAATCPECSAARNGRFCEGCGFDFAAESRGDASSLGHWTAEIAVDRAYYDRVGPDGVAFPGSRPPVVVPLFGDELKIGRGSAGVAMDIDLSGPLGDPAVSRHHATISRATTSGYQLVDAGSTNGTTLNDDPSPIAPNAPVGLADGDRIHVGAWTTITIRLDASVRRDRSG
jgi:hypothetical protein